MTYWAGYLLGLGISLVCWNAPHVVLERIKLRRLPKEQKNLREQVCAQICASIKNTPQDWEKDGAYTFDHKKSGLEIWVDSGMKYVKVWRPNEILFNPKQQKMIWLAYRSHIDNPNSPFMIDILNKLNPPPKV